MTDLPINELFYSIQGEGLLAGVPSLFIRTSGCNLRCRWCDTPQTSWNPTATSLSIQHILQWAASHPARHAVITGGEPMIQPAILPLAQALHRAGLHITIETAGTVLPRADAAQPPLHCDLMSISPKLADSAPADDDPRAAGWRDRHNARRIDTGVLAHLIHNYPVQLKFVLSRTDEIREIDELLQQLPAVSPDRILLMPEGITTHALAQRSAQLAELCKTRGFRFCPRLHIELWGHRPGV